MPPDGRLLVYRSEDIRNLSRLHQPSVCGYLSTDFTHLLPHRGDGVPAGIRDQDEEEGQGDSAPCCLKT